MAPEELSPPCDFFALPNDDTDSSQVHVSDKMNVFPKGAVLFGTICTFLAIFQLSIPKTPPRIEDSGLFSVKPAGRKPGLGGFVNKDMYTCQDAKVLGLGDSWYYDWITSPGGVGDRCHGQKLGKEFVPMINGVNATEKFLPQIMEPNSEIKRDIQNANAHFLLGYNEPDENPNHPHSVHPAWGAKAWPMVQQIAAAFEPPLGLVSPCPSSEAFDNDGRSWWLDQFFGNCTGECDPTKIEFIAMHDYTGDAQLLMKRINGASAIYGRKIWLTEFGIIRKGMCKGHTPTDAEHMEYMKQIIPLLEASDAVYRYAWFAARQTPNICAGSSGLLPYDSQSTKPTALGKLYRKLTPR